MQGDSGMISAISGSPTLPKMSEPGSPATPAPKGGRSPGSTMKKTATPGASNDMAVHGVFSYSGSTNVGTEYTSKHGTRPAPPRFTRDPRFGRN